MQLPAGLSVPQLEPTRVAQVQRLCDAIVESSRIGLDPAMLLDSLNDATANEFTLDDVMHAAESVGTEALACLAIAPPAPRVDAELAQWSEIVRRIRADTTSAFERAWWVELIERASGCGDVLQRLRAGGARSPEEVVAELFGAGVMDGTTV